MTSLARGLSLFLALILGNFFGASSVDAQARKAKRRSSAAVYHPAKGKARHATTATLRTRARKSSKAARRTVASKRRGRSRFGLIRLQRADSALKNTAQGLIAKDDLTYEDVQVRHAVLEALGDHAGAVVVMDPNNGRVYSIVNQQWAARKGFRPCSTLKPIVGLAGLKEGIIEAKTPVSLGRRTMPLTLTDALAHSNNLYFEKVGQQLGLKRLLEYARDFGLGRRTGINLANESPGRIPSFGNLNPRTVGRMSSHGDGFEVTALQLAVYTSALVNGGCVYQPQLVKSQESQASSINGNVAGTSRPKTTWTQTGPGFTPILLRRIEVPRGDRDEIISGMIGAVEFGTAKLARYPSLSIAGKTGTCTGEHLRLGLFTSFASVDKPNWVVAVITNGLGERGPLAAQVAGSIYQRLLNRTPESAVAGMAGGH